MSLSLLSGNFFVTADGMISLMSTETSLIEKHGSYAAMKINLKNKSVKLSMDDDNDDDDDDNPVGYSVSDKGLAIISIAGTTRADASWLTRICGIPTYTDIKLRFQQAYQDQNVKMVMMDINSPGGQANGTNAMSDFISNFSSKLKPVVAYTSGCCCSAALWYATAGMAFSADTDADIGSVGCVNVFISQARAMKENGLDVTVTRSGPFKMVPNPYEKLDAKGQEVLTEEVNRWYGRFVNGLSANLDQTPQKIMANLGSGKVFSAQQALNLGLVKSLISREQLIANLNAKLDNDSRLGR